MLGRGMGHITSGKRGPAGESSIDDLSIKPKWPLLDRREEDKDVRSSPKSLYLSGLQDMHGEGGWTPTGRVLQITSENNSKEVVTAPKSLLQNQNGSREVTEEKRPGYVLYKGPGDHSSDMISSSISTAPSPVPGSLRLPTPYSGPIHVVNQSPGHIGYRLYPGKRVQTEGTNGVHHHGHGHGHENGDDDEEGKHSYDNQEHALHEVLVRNISLRDRHIRNIRVRVTVFDLYEVVIEIYMYTFFSIFFSLFSYRIQL